MNLRQLFSRGNFCLKSVVIFKRPRFHIVALLGIGYFALTSSPATGAPTSHLSAAISHTHRYISVETLRPTRKQLEDYTGKMLPTQTVEPSQLCCVMVFDTQTEQFVGSGCYVVTGEPSAGAVEKFETVSAEFVGTRMF